MIDLKQTPYWRICADVVTFLKECLPVEGSDEYWRRITDRAEQISKVYADTDQHTFVNEQLYTVLDELDRIYKREVETNEAV